MIANQRLPGTGNIANVDSDSYDLSYFEMLFS